MQDVHCIADVEWLSQPARGRGSRVQGKPVCLVACSEDRNGITHHGQRSWYFGQGFAVRTAKFQLAVRLSLDLESLLVHGTMVPAAEQGEVREGSGASLGPVTDVVALPEAYATAREGAAAVAMVERST
jgi:hypothetical protein